MRHEGSGAVSKDSPGPFCAITVLPSAKGDDLGARLDTLLSRYEAYGFSGAVVVALDAHPGLSEALERRGRAGFRMIRA